MSEAAANAGHKLALVGIGKIARDQHLPAIAGNGDFELVATASRNAGIDGVRGFRSLEEALDAVPEINCVSLCTPPAVRYHDARRAIAAGKHTMLEKPPGATLAEVHDLIALAADAGVSLFATWHSRHADCVAAARNWLKDKTVERGEIVWKEDIRRWHPGQEWVFEPGGLGVFDPGINALSILTEIFPGRLHLARSTLAFPANRQTPIAADLVFRNADGIEVAAAFDWRQEGPQTWNIDIATDGGKLRLSQGGSRMEIDGREVRSGEDLEYAGLYRRFGALIRSGASDVDLTPMIHVCDAYALGERVEVESFDF